MARYVKSSFDENSDFFDMYVRSLSARYDDFLEDHILNSEIYSIHVNGLHVGYFGIHEKEMLTQFFMPTSEMWRAQAVFTDVLIGFHVKNAFVPTCDEFFLSLCLDNHKSIKMQAYFFEDSGRPVRPAEFPREWLHRATLRDLPEILSIAGDFVDRPAERIDRGELYVLRGNGEFLGLGVAINNRIMKSCMGTGMFTSEKHRRKGVGRSIILHLKDICRAAGRDPLPGCWYYNHNSKRTLESAGYISKTRLLCVEF